MGPLEVVEQRPHEVAAYVHAAVDRSVERSDVLPQVVDAQRVGERIAVDHRRIEEGRAVFGDIERRTPVAILDPDEDLGECGREDLPAGLGVRRPRLGLGAAWKGQA